MTTIHASCWCTELESLRKRVFVDSPPTTMQGALKSVAKRTAQCFSQWALRPWSVVEVKESMPKAKQKLYQQALESLEVDAFGQKWDREISLFVKADKLTFKESTPDKPRAIQSRPPRFNLVVGTIVKPLEHAAYRWKGFRRGVKRTQVFAKGLCPVRRGRLLQAKVANFDEPVVISLDASSFDASVTIDMLRLLHRTYKESIVVSEEVAAALEWQLRNKGKTSHGAKYRIKGNRMSGDPDTAFGNCLTTWFIVVAAMKRTGVKKWDTLIDGDDCVLIVERRDFPGEEAIIDAWRNCGFNLTMDITGLKGPVVPEEIEFCRGRCIVGESGRWNLVRDVRRAVATFGVTHKYNDNFEVYLDVLKGSAMGELTVSGDVPCISFLAWETYKRLEDRKARFDTDFDYKYQVRYALPKLAAKEPKVDWATRVSVERAWGISIAQQLEFESSCAQRVAGLFEKWDVVSDCVEGVWLPQDARDEL